MSVLEAVVLGVTQGITEFLPISSDGHLAIAYRLMGMTPDLTFEVFLHLATLIAIVAYFHKDVVALLRSLLPEGKGSHERRLALLIALGTFVSGVIALLLEPVVEPMSASMIWVGIWLLGTSALLTLAELTHSRTVRDIHPDQLSWGRTILVALAQGLAVLPGLSRSGSTISGGMMVGLDRAKAARFSFLLGIPIIALASAKSAVDIVRDPTTMPGLVPSIAGFLAALVAGYLAISFLLRYVREHSLVPFAVYTAIVGLAVILWQLTS